MLFYKAKTRIAETDNLKNWIYKYSIYSRENKVQK